jgi:hypothetical protein
MKQYLIFIICLAIGLSISSCGFKPPSKVTQGFKYCYDGKNTGLDTIINIQGYYTMGHPHVRSGLNAVYKPRIDTVDINFMFFPDGIFLYNFFDHNKNIPEYFKRIVENTNNGKTDHFFKSFYWGRYIVEKDTIKAQYFNIPKSLNDGWFSGEIWFNIISKNEVKEIDNPSTAEKNKWSESQGFAVYKSLTATFNPVGLLPSSNTKLKKKKWFWCESAEK